MDNALEPYFVLFSDTLGELNIDCLLEDNYYLSKQPLQAVRRKLSKIAREMNAPGQEYVETCSGAVELAHSVSEVE